MPSQVSTSQDQAMADAESEENAVDPEPVIDMGEQRIRVVRNPYSSI